MTSSGERPPGERLQQFLLEHVESYEELDLLLLLRRQRTRDWTPEDCALELGLPKTACLSALQRLRTRDLVAQHGQNGGFRYAPGSLDLAARVAQVAGLYRNQRLKVAMLMSMNAVARLRVAACNRFADTFRIRDHSR